MISVDEVTECIETLVRVAVFGTPQPIAFDGPERKMALTPDGKRHLAEPERPARSRTADSEPPAATAEAAAQPAEAASEQPRLQVIEGGAGEPAEEANDMPKANGSKPPAAEAAESKPKRKRSHIRY